MPALHRYALLAGIAAFITVMIVLLGLAVRADAQPRSEYMPCSTDEGPDADRNCVWDARHNGNGMGDSYFVGEGGKVYPLPHHIAHALVYGR
jgi:hypothetical protein